MRSLATAVVLLAAISSSAFAQSAARSFGVSAAILDGCTVTAITVDFGSYAGQATSPAVDSVGQVTVTCSIGTAFSVRLNNGLNNAGAQRRMRRTAGTELLNYGLFRNAARTQRWGQNAAQRIVGVGVGTPQVLPVYARLSGGQIVPAGTYQDTITVTVQY